VERRLHGADAGAVGVARALGDHRLLSPRAPASRNARLQLSSSCAGTWLSRETASSGSPRSRRKTNSVLRWALHRSGRALGDPHALPRPPVGELPRGFGTAYRVAGGPCWTTAGHERRVPFTRASASEPTIPPLRLSPQPRSMRGVAGRRGRPEGAAGRVGRGGNLQPAPRAMVLLTTGWRIAACSPSSHVRATGRCQC
jgi:hypothetical protein